MHVNTGAECCAKSYIEQLFDLGKSMWKKHSSVFQDHDKYIHNDIVKHFRV